jgi:hypothetical protein
LIVLIMRRNWLVIEGKVLAGTLSVAFVVTVIEAIAKGLALQHLVRHLGSAIVIALGIGALLWWLDRSAQTRTTTMRPFIALATIVIICFIAAHSL